MIDSIEGKIVDAKENYIVLQVLGFGIRVYITKLSKHIGEHIFLKTKMVLKDESVNIFGFESNLELDLFVNLNKVSGIGPKTAIKMIAQAGAEPLVQAITSQNIKFISGLNGIGPKTAKRIVLELEKQLIPSFEENSFILEAISIIANMGHTLNESTELVQRARKNMNGNYTIQDLVRESLKVLI